MKWNKKKTLKSRCVKIVNFEGESLRKWSCKVRALWRRVVKDTRQDLKIDKFGLFAVIYDYPRLMDVNFSDWIKIVFQLVIMMFI